MKITHPIAPVYNEKSEKLILGSFPSEASRASGFFYGHPQNRFWRVLAAVYGDRTPETKEEKIEFLTGRRLALWDVAAECDVTGSADSSIADARPNDLGIILNCAPIKQIFVNGRLAQSLYNKFILPITGQNAVYLPSTSPANAAWSVGRLTDAWSIIRGDNNGRGKTPPV